MSRNEAQTRFELIDPAIELRGWRRSEISIEVKTPPQIDIVDCQLRSGIHYSRRPPRVHDLRHAFACRVLQRWQASKKGAVHRLAILSRFLGHTQIRDTYWYFSAFPQLLTEALGHFESPDHDDS